MTLHLVHMHRYPIFSQLQIEEALLRQNTCNWCLINEGSPPAIVMGISGHADALIDVEEARRAHVPIIRRFSGGGTVIVDEHTLFVTFIFQKNAHSFPAYPEPIMRWSEGLYKTVFSHPTFALRENDYVFDEKKCGGNAQYIKKDRWLHHTSFLWDYQEERMNLLRHPAKTPNYRQGRTHTDFLCKLRDYFSEQHLIVAALKAHLSTHYTLVEIPLEHVTPLCTGDFRHTTAFHSQ